MATESHGRKRREGRRCSGSIFSCARMGVIRFDVPGQDVGFLGRYEIKGNRLRVCYPGPLVVGKPPQPPEKIESGPKVTVAEWERAD
jgi:hypothetical protein